MAKRGKHDSIRVRGFFRVNLVEHYEDGIPKIVGDSGWQENMVVTLGKQQYLALALAGAAGSKQVARGILGTGGAPASNDSMIAGSFGDAAAGSHNRPPGSTSTGQNAQTVSVQFAFTWASVNSFATTTRNISNIAIINDTTSAGTIFAGNTYSSSLLNTNQDVQASYVINFS